MPAPAPTLDALPYTYDARVYKIVDSDTLDLSVDLGFKASLVVRVRLLRLNAPEAKTPEGIVATAFVTEWLAPRPDDPPFPLRIATVKDRTEIHGRYLATVSRRSDGAELNSALLASGNAVAYPPVAPKGVTP